MKPSNKMQLNLNLYLTIRVGGWDTANYYTYIGGRDTANYYTYRGLHGTLRITIRIGGWDTANDYPYRGLGHCELISVPSDGTVRVSQKNG